jgi:hypothetical protein
MTAPQGQVRNAVYYTDTGATAVTLLASTLHEGLVPSSENWVQYRIPGADPQTQDTMESISTLVWNNIEASNFDAEIMEAFKDGIVIGWFVLFCDEAPRGGYRFERLPASSCWITSTTQGGAPDVLYRSFELSAEAAVEAYGQSASPEVQAEAKSKPDARRSYLQVVEPNPKFKTGRRNTDMPFSSTTVDVKAKQIVRRSGYNEQPFFAVRWNRLPNSEYGVGQVYNVLPALKRISKLQFDIDAASDVAVNGAWVVADDGVIGDMDTVKIGPNAIITMKTVDSIKPLTSPANMNFAAERIEALTKSVQDGMFTTFLQTNQTPGETATEVNRRLTLFWQKLSPILGRLQSDLIRPMLWRCFGLAYRAGVLAQVPGIQGLDLSSATIQYRNPVQGNQDQITSQSMLSTASELSQLGASVGNTQLLPTVLDIEKFAAKLLSLNQVPADTIHTNAEIAQIKQQQMQTQVAQQAAQAMVAQNGGQLPGSQPQGQGQGA